PRPAAPRHRGGVLALAVEKGDVDRLRTIGPEVGASLFQVLAATWALLLGRYAGEPDVVFATPADLRRRPELEGVVGYCLTPVVVRGDLTGDPTFADLVVRVRNAVLDGLDRLVPFERLVRELGHDAATAANPIYQTMIVLEPQTAAPDPAWSIHQMEGEIGDAVGSAKVDLELGLDERPEGDLDGRLIYDRELFDTTTAERVAARWLTVVRAVAADPTVAISRIGVLGPDEERRQMVEWNATATSRPDRGIPQLVRAHAERDPASPAASAGEVSLDYGELARRAAAVAGRLRADGVGPGDVVGVCSVPSVDLVTGALGVLQAGAAHLLLDPSLPVEEAARRLADAGAVMVLAAAELEPSRFAPLRVMALDAVAMGAAPADAEAAFDADAVCAVQDGVALGHGAVAASVAALAAELGAGPGTTALVLPAAMFETPVTDLWLPLTAGAKLVLAPADAAATGRALSRVVAAEHANLLHAAPAGWRHLIDTGLRSARALRALSTGEPLPRELADAMLDRCRVVWHGYAAPATGVATLGRVQRGEPVTIGRPLANVRAYVLDDYDQPAPTGFAGRLVIAGDGIAYGHEHFQDPFRPGPAYRTGERARWRSDGRIERVLAAAGP
ncbi:MAG: hypothetical protein QOF76_4911, partial [Solirubrobacteraceae bacterium]|nr:hypothetical protein [Solirubrobacteraceae bacterium]